jgi:hypothetical protein
VGGSRSVPIGTHAPPIFLNLFSILRPERGGSRFGADPHHRLGRTVADGWINLPATSARGRQVDPGSTSYSAAVVTDGTHSVLNASLPDEGERPMWGISQTSSRF